jgi:predicted metal-dependent phosphotriesterase family hydrolase
VDELRKARDLGLRTIVEVSPRRDAAGLRRVAQESGVTIIACTGFYDYNDEEKRYSVDQFERHMMDEIADGIDGTGIRPGVIKVQAANADIKEHERRAFAAAARVQKETGLPLCTHAVFACGKQQQILEENGADLSKVYFSHVEAEFGWENRTLKEELEYLARVVQKGSTLCFNNFGNWAHTKPEVLAAIIKDMISRGCADRMVATMDFVWDYDKEGIRKILWEDINKDGKRRTYSYLLSDVVPWLRSVGIAQPDIDRMIKDNPRRLFELNT